MKISVVIATYGDERWRSLAWSRAYPSVADQADDVVVHHSPHDSISTARNEAAAQATGDWLIFLDADDELAAEYILGMRKAIESYAETRKDVLRKRKVLFTPAVQYVRRGRPQDPMFWPEVDLRLGNWLIIGTAISNIGFDALGGFRDYPHGLEDFDLWSRAHKMQFPVVKVPGSIYVVHWNEQSKHRQLQRNRKAYMHHYHAVCRTNWPELYEGVSA